MADMRVLHVHSGNLYGGVETFLLTLAREAARTPAMVSAFALAFEGRLAEELRVAGSAPHVLGAARVSRPATVWRARRALADYLRAGAFDLVVCHQAWAQVLFAGPIREAGLPDVLWLHTVSDGRHWLDRWVSRRAPDLVVCNSAFTAARVRPRFPATRIEWVHCPLPARVRPIDSTARAEIRAQLGTPIGDAVIVSVSRLEPLKGHRTMLEALARLGEVPAWTCWIVGGAQRPSEAGYLHELQTLARRLGIADRVRFTGERADVGALLQAADVYCQPNVRPEAFGLSLVEALATGLPVVTSDLGGAREIVDASCGILTPPGDASAVAGAVGALLGDAGLRARLGAAARSRPDVLWDPTRQMRRIEALLASVADPVGRQVKAC